MPARPPATLPKNEKTLAKIAPQKDSPNKIEEYEDLFQSEVNKGPVEAVRPSKQTHVSKLFGINYEGDDYEEPLSEDEDEDEPPKLIPRKQRGGKKSIKRRKNIKKTHKRRKFGKKSYKKRKSCSRRKRSIRRR